MERNTSETSVMYQTTRRYIPEDSLLQGWPLSLFISFHTAPDISVSRSSVTQLEHKNIFLRRERGKPLLPTATTQTFSFYVELLSLLKAPCALSDAAPPSAHTSPVSWHYLVKYLISTALCNYMPFNKWVISVSGTKADLYRQLEVGFRTFR
jgi:hypothetical protein